MNIDIFETITASTLNRVSYLAKTSEPITLRITSPGGDVFAALSIYNLLKEKQVTTEILGLCASAATLIACAGKTIRMASNGLYMIHSPSVLLFNQYDKQALEKLNTSLEKVQESILQVYQSRVKDFAMPSEELWLNAQEAKALGLVDEISGDVEMFKDAAHVFINSLSFDIGTFPQARLREVKNKMGDSALREQILNEERGRIAALQALRTSDAVTNAIIDTAISKGQTAEELSPYLDAIKKAQPTTAQNTFANMAAEQMTSGAMGVSAQSAPTQDEVKQAMINKMIEFANKGGGKQ